MQTIMFAVCILTIISPSDLRELSMMTNMSLVAYVLPAVFSHDQIGSVFAEMMCA